MEKDSEIKIARRIVKTVATRLASSGYKKTKPTFICKRYPLLIAFYHFHKFSFGPRFRIHFGIRVLNDEFPAAALNGPSFEQAGKYDESKQSIKNCIEKMFTICIEQGIPWFEEWTKPNRLITHPMSPLDESSKTNLKQHLDGFHEPHRVSESLKIFGLEMNE